MKQKYDNDYAWLYQHTRKHLGTGAYNDPKNEKDAGPEKDNDGINVDSDVIVSEYRLLYLKYRE